MEQQSTTIDEAFDVGIWVGRKQAFALVAGRCLAADAEILFEIREKKLFRTMEKTWEDFCVKRLGFGRSYADRIIRQFKELGPNFSKLSCFMRIKPAEYRLIVGAVTEDGLSYGGEVIALESENGPKLAGGRDSASPRGHLRNEPNRPGGTVLRQSREGREIRHRGIPAAASHATGRRRPVEAADCARKLPE